MFDTMKIAKKIKEARIAQNMTQMKLAEEMDVSFQAVSSWERGNSMPDISKLEALCHALKLTVEELLGMESTARAVQKYMDIERTDGEEAAPDPLTVTELQDIAPIIPPADLAEQVSETVGKEECIDLGVLAAMAPYLDEDDLEELLEEAEVKNVSELAALAPYLDEDVLGELVLQAIDTSEVRDVVGLAPYLDEDVLEEIADRLIAAGKVDQMAGLYPYMDADTLKKIMKVLMRNKDLKALQAIMPYC